MGLETNLRKFTLLLSDGRSALSGRLNVCKPLALANDLFRGRLDLSGGGNSRLIEAA